MGGCASGAESSPGDGEKLGPLTEYFRNGYLRGDPYRGPKYAWDRHGGALIHEKTGISVCAEAIDLRPAAPKDPAGVFFHYTDRQVFDHVRSTLERKGSMLQAYARLKARHPSYGEGVFACVKDPEAFGNKNDIVLNWYWPTNAEVSEVDRGDGSLVSNGDLPSVGPNHRRNQQLRNRILVKYKASSCDYCIPLFAPTSLIVPVGLQAHDDGLDPSCRLVGAGGWHPDFWKFRDDAEARFSRDGSTRKIEATMKEAAKINNEKGPEHAESLEALDQVANQLQMQGRNDEAEILLRRTYQVRRDQLGPQDRDTLASAARLGQLLQSQRKHDEALDLLQEALNGRRRLLGRVDKETQESTFQLAHQYQLMNRPEAAIELLRDAVDTHEKELGRNHPDTLRMRSRLGALLFVQGNHHEAETQLESAYRDSMHTSGYDNLCTLEISESLAHVYERQHKHEEAEKLLRDMVRGLGDSDGNSSLRSRASNNLAVFLQARGKFEEAEALLKRALEEKRASVGETDISYLTSLYNLACLHEAMGRYDLAEGEHLKALRGREQVLGLVHPNTLESLNNLASVYQARWSLREAENLHRRALKGYMQVFGPVHRHTMISRQNLAVVLQEMGHEDALQVQRQAYEDRQKVLGTTNAETLESLESLAGLYDKLDRHAEAERLREYALDACENKFGQEDILTLRCVNRWAAALQAKGQLDQAKKMLDFANKVCEDKYDKEHPISLDTLNNLGLLWYEEGLYDRAEPALQRVLDGHRKALGQWHPTTLTSTANLAALLKARGKHAKALELQQDVLRKQEDILGKEHPSTLNSLTNVASLQALTGRRNEALDLHKQALESKRQRLGGTHPATQRSVEELTDLLLTMQRNDEALEIQRRFVAELEHKAGKSHDDTLMALAKLAYILKVVGLASPGMALGSMEEAEMHIRRVVFERQTRLGWNHPDTLEALNDLAAVLQEMGKYGEAEQWQWRVLEHAMRVECKLESALDLDNHREEEHFEREVNHLLRYYRDHEQQLPLLKEPTLTYLNNLAVHLHARERYPEAVPMQEMSWQGCLKRLGPRHEKTLESRENLALLEEERGRLEQAEEHRRKVCEVRWHLDPKGMKTMQSLSAFGLLLEKMEDRREEALRCLKTAYTGLRDHLTDRSPSTQKVLNSYAQLLAMDGTPQELEEAERLYRTLLQVREHSAPTHASTLKTARELAQVLRKRRKYHEAEELLKMCHGRYNSMSVSSTALRQPQRPALASPAYSVEENIASVMLDMGRFGEAEELTSNVVRHRMENLGVEHTATQDTQKKLARIRRRQRRHEVLEDQGMAN